MTHSWLHGGTGVGQDDGLQTSVRPIEHGGKRQITIIITRLMRSGEKGKESGIFAFVWRGGRYRVARKVLLGLARGTSTGSSASCVVKSID